jgi:hypothetical protein
VVIGHVYTVQDREHCNWSSAVGPRAGLQFYRDRAEGGSDLFCVKRRSQTREAYARSELVGGGFPLAPSGGHPAGGNGPLTVLCPRHQCAPGIRRIIRLRRRWPDVCRKPKTGSNDSRYSRLLN